MKTFNQFTTEINEQVLQLEVLLYLSENEDMLFESETAIFEGINDRLNKVGLKLHKSKGILDYIKSFVGSVGKLFLHIIKGDYEKSKELVQSMKKEDVLDFLYKLDLGTLHLFTGPIHMIDAWTGWDLGVNLQHKVEQSKGITDVLKQAIQKVKTSIETIFGNNPSKKKTVMKYVDNIEKMVVV
jgi:hypothetical protein